MGKILTANHIIIPLSVCFRSYGWDLGHTNYEKYAYDVALYFYKKIINYIPLIYSIIKFIIIL